MTLDLARLAEIEREKRLSMQETVNRLVTEVERERKRAAHAEAEVERVRREALGIVEKVQRERDALKMVRHAAEAFLEFTEAWDTIDPKYRDDLRRAIDATKDPTR